ncbi:hybrid sensor histidine kinase/response regulator [Enhygromyxa salina]|uniref:histidine kinase n=1 Tax=Enhygromyxa salina TaxID=215803 RepID=A0A2S9YF73_9BACT|nr:PAS domain-containing protein [Enhygromyxa salina]PRQ03764.1 Blue-light-activated protein [Enhygromyxa salina]
MRVGSTQHDVGICLLDADGAVLEFDADFARIVELPWASVSVGRVLSELVRWAPPLPLPSGAATSVQQDLGDARVELVIRTATTGPVAYCVSAERKHTETVLARQLRVARQTLDSVIEASPLAILTVDERQRVVMWNRAAERTFGWTREEILGRPYPLVPEDERPEFEELFDKVVLRGSGFTGVESTRLRKDGSRVETRMHTAPLRDAEERVTGAMAMLEDLTKTRLLEEKVRHSQKMEAVGRLAGGIAHDFNNLLTVVFGAGELLSLDRTLSPSSRERVSEILGVAQSARELVAQLMTFSRRQVVRPQVIDLNERLRESGKLLRRLIGHDITLEFDVPDIPAWVRLDPSQLDQVLVNLAVNAADAMPQGGFLRYSSSVRELSVAAEPLAAGRYACLEVRDSGTGIAADILPQIFEPFFTTKGAGSGTGLGLANVYGVARQSGGNVEVESEAGRGACFRVHLPLVRRPLTRTHSGPHAVPRGSENILLVEDNAGVRVTMTKTLQALGYTVTAACDGVEALELFDAGLAVDLVLTDLSMPRMGGAEMAKRLAAQLAERLAEPSGAQPKGLPVMFMSGNLDVEDLRAQVEQGRAKFLQKPVSLRDLSQAVREVLDGLQLVHASVGP